MKKLVLASVLIIFLGGCDKKCCTNYAVNIFLKYQNSNGDDLLDPKTMDALNEKDLEVYVLRNGIRIRIFNAMMDAQKNFKIRGSSTEKYFIQFYFDTAKESLVKKKSTMFITYKNGTEDKLVGEFNEDVGVNISLQNVWINDVLVGRPLYTPEKAFILTK